MIPPLAPLAPRRLAALAAVLAALALVAHDPVRPRGAAVDVAALAAAVEREEDHVTAIELARWIRDGKERLRVLDVRPDSEYAAYHIPGAERVSVTALAHLVVDAAATVVLYSEGGPHAAQGWFLLRARGIERVYFLCGGLWEWETEVLEATIAADATPEERERFAEVAELSRWFGGMPRTGEPRPASALDAVPLPSGSGRAGAAPRRARRLSC